MPNPYETSTNSDGSTLFERMRRVVEADRPEREPFDIPRFLNAASGERGAIISFEITPSAIDGSVRFTRTDSDGVPGVVMQERREDGSWHDSWSLPTESIDAREGMMGWLNSQSDRWAHFARMVHRRGGDELTRWIFELMVIPSTAQARPTRFSPRPHVTIDHYAGYRSGTSPYARHQTRRVVRDDCSCRPGSLQSTRDY